MTHHLTNRTGALRVPRQERHNIMRYRAQSTDTNPHPHPHRPDQSGGDSMDMRAYLAHNHIARFTVDSPGADGSLVLTVWQFDGRQFATPVPLDDLAGLLEAARLAMLPKLLTLTDLEVGDRFRWADNSGHDGDLLIVSIGEPCATRKGYCIVRLNRVIPVHTSCYRDREVVKL